MKTLFLLALLALVASTTFAQYSEVGGWYNEVGGGGGSQQCPQERPKLSSCKDYVMERCFTMKDFPVTWPTNGGRAAVSMRFGRSAASS
uniref:Puroindoline b n=1 Tax=Triticum aestivum TaxID=4565 RepID=Q6L713_WHEAT|nr:puroindoline b like protein [Triticum aestivum]BAF81891.1 puroindoline b [Triticum aestivum]